MIEEIGGVDAYEDEVWKMIAFASRYGHQQLLPMTGEVTLQRVKRFCDALSIWIEAEQKHGGSSMNSMAEGGG